MAGTIAVVQARMGSSRLPGKVLADLAGRPLLAVMLGRLQPLLDDGTLDHVVVATSVGATDDPIAALGDDLGVAVVRGSEADVLGRFGAALEVFGAERVVRLTADCPLIDPGIVASLLATADELGAAYASTTLQRSFPDGLDCEVVDVALLRRALAEATRPEEREHVTPWLQRQAGQASVWACWSPDPADDAGDARWTVDTADDLAFLRATLDARPELLSADWRTLRTVLPEPRRPSGTLRLRPDASAAGTVIVANTGWAAAPAQVRAWEAVREGVVVDRPVAEVRGDAATLHAADATVAAAVADALALDAQVWRMQWGSARWARAADGRRLEPVSAGTP